jgi:hypothetical protein
MRDATQGLKAVGANDALGQGAAKLDELCDLAFCAVGERGFGLEILSNSGSRSPHKLLHAWLSIIGSQSKLFAGNERIVTSIGVPAAQPRFARPVSGV